MFSRNNNRLRRDMRTGGAGLWQQLRLIIVYKGRRPGPLPSPGMAVRAPPVPLPPPLPLFPPPLPGPVRPGRPALCLALAWLTPPPLDTHLAQYVLLVLPSASHWPG